MTKITKFVGLDVHKSTISIAFCEGGPMTEAVQAGTIPNDTGHMSGWIANSQAVKPGNEMPPQPISPSDLHDVVAYLQSLK